MIVNKVIGIMSGTSLDGLDIAYCTFSFNKTWNFQIIESTTISYSDQWKEMLSHAPNLSGIELLKLHKEYGQFIGQCVNDFLQNKDLKVDLIASHGHTVFHQPENKITLQIGDGAEIASQTGITTISDFRSLDVALGGQGAPLVPIGDELLFPEFDYCLNLGGFANISFKSQNKRIAFDIGPANIILNYLTQKMGHTYDQNGNLGKMGRLNTQLLSALDTLEYYKKPFPKSLGKEWLDQEFIPILNQFHIPINDQLTTVYHHIANQITKVIKSDDSKLLITGGGAYNTFLIDLIKEKTEATVVIPDKEIIEFKEALIFAFLGVLRFHKQVNCLSSVTGASKDCSGGVIHLI